MTPIPCQVVDVFDYNEKQVDSSTLLFSGAALDTKAVVAKNSPFRLSIENYSYLIRLPVRKPLMMLSHFSLCFQCVNETAALSNCWLLVISRQFTVHVVCLRILSCLFHVRLSTTLPVCNWWFDSIVIDLGCLRPLLFANVVNQCLCPWCNLYCLLSSNICTAAAN